MNPKNHLNTFYIILSLQAAYFSNIICGKFLLSLLLIYFFYNILSNYDIKKKLALFLTLFLILFLGRANTLFLIAIPLLLLFIKNDKNNFYQNFFLNSLLALTVVENAYYLGVNLNLLYYYWGLPIIAIALGITKTFPKRGNTCLSVLLIIIACGQIFFNQQNFNHNIYTYSNQNSICARYSLLKDYFNKVNNLKQEQTTLKQEKKSFNILALCETDFLSKKNIILPGRNYILLGEHDNMNEFIENYPYFNNDSFFRKAPWYLYVPNINACFKYLLNRDIFYSSNIGSTLRKGYPLIWEYDNFGKPILLVTFLKINNSNVFVFGDSDLFVDKLLPYNINFLAGLLGKVLSLYPLFVILFTLTNLCLVKNKKILASIFFFCMTLVYFLPLKKDLSSQINVYSQVPYLTAHTSSYPSSILNFLAQNNTAVVASNQKKSNVQVINKKQKWKDLQNSKLVYVLSDTKIKLNNDTLYCSNIKLGNELLENNMEIIDSRFFIINGNISNSGYYTKDETAFVCTGSPQLNYKLTKQVVIDNEKK